MELAIKNQEYKAKDDTKVQGEKHYSTVYDCTMKQNYLLLIFDKKVTNVIVKFLSMTSLCKLLICMLTTTH